MQKVILFSVSEKTHIVLPFTKVKQLSKIHLSLLFIFIVSFSFASEVLALTATRQYDIATFDHTAGKQRYTI
jgi:hypothetical protein